MFVPEPDPTPERRRMYGDVLAHQGYVMNTTRAWAWQPGLAGRMSGLIDEAYRAAGLTHRERAVLVVATAAGLGDSYCTLSWGKRLAEAAGVSTAVAVVEGADLDDHRERALARWARKVATAPNDTTADDVDELRAVGFGDAEIVAVTAYVAARLAFSTFNDALGASPDRELADAVPPELSGAVRFGRPAAGRGEPVASSL